MRKGKEDQWWEIGWGIAKHIYNGSGRDRRDCASWYTGEKPSHQILQKKTETDNKGGRDTMLHFFYGACHRLLHCSLFYLMRVKRKGGRNMPIEIERSRIS